MIGSQIENIQEQINIINVENKKSQEFGAALKFKITRYDNLKKVIEDLNRSLRPEVVVNVLSATVYSLISNSCGTALFYLLDNHCQKLNLMHSIKEDKQLAIFSKEGDIFDYWVLRHSRELIIEDLKNDFRFDLDTVQSQEIRQVLSLISSPLISHHSLLGLLRLESDKSASFNQDDLRFLSLVSGLGAVALENSLLFQKTQDLAIHDDLTGLYTKQYFIGRLKDEAKRCQRLDQRLALMMIDIDFFKQYNDKFGHIAGDIVLKKVSFLLKDNLNELSPLLCRFGGEEFLVMLSDIDKQRSLTIAENLRQRVEREKILLRRQNTSITVSIGLACLPLDTKDEDELIQQADKAMYDAKRKGRNRVCCT
ncbi:MAG: sensor domain-containing diguanylate cyclase [Candidatus Omnitrophica bacterium]|nr:sensor domain-containing diguanylate cyclase [Candidatus Omnitrophota bacterium]MBU1923933.1 sensor domain-containing diguanylate cyclase [Candidatus Omnitrophota bacterium]